MFRFCIIGAGSIANTFCDAVNMLDGVQVAAVGSKSKSRAEDFARRNSLPAAYGDYREMLTAEKPDAVYVATTHNFHRENILLCVELGLPVLCEKCMVLTERQAREVFAAADKKNVFVMEAMWTRLLPAYQKAAALIAGGEIGDVVSAHYSFGFHAKRGSSRLEPKLAGGAMYDLGVYAIEGLAGLINQPIAGVKSHTHRSEDGIDLTDQVILAFGGCSATFEVSVRTDMGGGHCEVYGTAGKLVLPDAIRPSECRVTREDGSGARYSFPYKNGFQYQITHFIECIRAGKAESDAVPHALTVECARVFDICLGTA